MKKLILPNGEREVIFEFDPVLAVVQEVADPDAVIAGGFVRDTILGREPKDCDIWYHSSVSAEMLLTAILMRVPDAFLLDNVGSYPGQEQRVENVIKLQVGNKFYDVIAVDSPIGQRAVNLLDRFDIGLCMAAYDNQRPIVTFEFTRDVRGKTLTVYTQHLVESDLRHTLINHLPRMRKKFDEFDVEFV